MVVALRLRKFISTCSLFIVFLELVLDFAIRFVFVSDGAVLELVLMVDRNGKHDASTYTTEDPTKTVYLSFEFVTSAE